MPTEALKIPSPFSRKIYLRHLEEASFLYEQRGTLFKDPEVTWLDIGDFEERFEAHIDALTEGGAEALHVCRELALAGDSGELHAAVRVFCRHGRLDLIEAAMDALDHEDRERTLAVRNALKHEWPRGWNDQVGRLLKEMPGRWFSTLPKLIGFRRLPEAAALIHLIPICPPDHLFPVIWALGRIRARGAYGELLKGLKRGNTTLRAMAALSALKLGETLDHIRHLDGAATDFWHMVCIALAGSSRDVPFACSLLNDPEAGNEAALALGVLGDVRAVEPLLQAMQKEELGEAAALALNLITGAELYETVFIPDAIDEDDLFDEEIEKLRTGEPLYPPGEAPGKKLVRLSQNTGEWLSWWQTNRSRFEAGTRYRNGWAYSPQCLLDNLQDQRSPLLVRQVAYEELVVRYGIDVRFETDMLVKDQEKAIAQIAVRVETGKSEWEDGKWYFGGHAVA